MDIIKHINWVDIIVIILFLRISYVSFQEGLTRGTFPLIGSVAVIVLSLHYYVKFGKSISENLFNLPVALANFMSFAILSLSIGMIFKILSALLNKVVTMQWHPLIERLGGLVVGILRAVVVTSLVLIILALMPLPYLQWSIRDRSLTGMYFLKVGPTIYEKIAVFLPMIKAGESKAYKDQLVQSLAADKSISPGSKRKADTVPH